MGQSALDLIAHLVGLSQVCVKFPNYDVAAESHINRDSIVTKENARMSYAVASYYCSLLPCQTANPPRQRRAMVISSQATAFQGVAW